MSSKIPRSKLGLLDEECNSLAKGLFCMMLFLSLIIVALDKFVGSWYFKYFRCLLLLCNIIPISMRINLDFAKLFYAGQINNDKYIKGTMVRNSSIPEELGRIQYLLSDKTGTLTQNNMKFKRLVMDIGEFNDSQELMEEMKDLLRQGLDGVRRCFDNSFEMDNDKDSVEFATVQETEGAERFDHKTTDVLDPDNYAINTEGGERFDTFTESEDQRRNFLTLEVE